MSKYSYLYIHVIVCIHIAFLCYLSESTSFCSRFNRFENGSSAQDILSTDKQSNTMNMSRFHVRFLTCACMHLCIHVHERVDHVKSYGSYEKVVAYTRYIVSHQFVCKHLCVCM